MSCDSIPYKAYSIRGEGDMMPIQKKMEKQLQRHTITALNNNR